MRSRMAAVVLNYRSAAMTLKAVEALEASTRKPDDVIVVDNGSGDGSAEALAHLDPVLTGRNLGFSGGCNAGIAAARARGAELILLVNSDAQVELRCVERLEAALDHRPDIGIAGPVLVSGSTVESIGISYSLHTGRMRHEGFEQRRANLTVPDCRVVDGVSGCVMLIRASLFEQLGLLADEFFFSFEDLDFCLRARKAGFLTACIGTATAHHEGAHSIGKASPRRIYFATRNQLLLAERALPLAPLASLLRGGTIAGLNLAHALWTSRAPLVPGVGAVVAGVRDHLRGRYGEG